MKRTYLRWSLVYLSIFTDKVHSEAFYWKLTSYQEHIVKNKIKIQELNPKTGT
jgi:hypothetical protein